MQLFLVLFIRWYREPQHDLRHFRLQGTLALPRTPAPANFEAAIPEVLHDVNEGAETALEESFQVLCFLPGCFNFKLSLGVELGLSVERGEPFSDERGFPKDTALTVRRVICWKNQIVGGVNEGFLDISISPRLLHPSV